MVSVVATWAVIQWRAAMWGVVGLFVVIVVVVYWIYSSFGPLSELHPINWILSYCAFALFVAALARGLIDALKTLDL